MSKGREPQIILKTDQRTVVLELGVGGKFAAKSSGWDENRTFLEGDVLKSNTLWPPGCQPTFRPGRARHRLQPSTIFRPRSDGVTGYVTSSHGAATPLRYGVTGHLAGNQPVRSRKAIVDRPIASAASRVLVCGLWIAFTGRSPRPSRSSRRSQDWPRHGDTVREVTPSRLTLETPIQDIAEEQADSLRLLIVVGGHGAFVATFGNHAEIVLTHSNRETP
jgi:hypothetical protein